MRHEHDNYADQATKSYITISMLWQISSIDYNRQRDDPAHASYFVIVKKNTICNVLITSDIITIVKTRISDGYMHTLKLTQIGNSVGLILPKEVLLRLKLVKGDTVFLTDAPGAVTITPHDPSFEEQLEIGREFMREYRDTFNALAK